MRHSLTLLATFATLSLSACYLYSGDDDCLYGEGGTYADVELRNPDSGMCELFGSWTPGDDCEPRDYGRQADEAPTVAMPDWGVCDGYCAALDEMTCIAARGCRAAYAGSCPEGFDCASTEYTFAGCWQVAPSGPIQGECSGLDAQECSRHDDCSAQHYGVDCTPEMGCDPLPPPAGPPMGNFEACVAEVAEMTGCFEDLECPDDYVCNAEDVCLPSPYGCYGSPYVPCDDRCYGYCVPEENVDPGSCYGEVSCDSLPPDCPAATMPGVDDGCFTGQCIPLAECEAAPACVELDSEYLCIARPDCAPLYEGVDCSCDEYGCTCEEWLYQECEAADLTCSNDDPCPDGLLCCYPCGVPECDHQCTLPDGDGECPAYP